MLWALTIPKLEERTDFGVIDPEIVLTKMSLVSAEDFEVVVCAASRVVRAVRLSESLTAQDCDVPRRISKSAKLVITRARILLL